MWGTAFKYQLGAALLFLTALVLIHPSVEAGMNDDWSFVRTTLDLAQTGHLRYNGWSAPLIGFQAYWGALFIKLFGFSFLAVRASVWVLTLLSIPVMWSLFRSAGLNEGQAFFGLTALLLSPLNLPNLTTFMTDMPAFFLFAVALLSAMRAWGAENDRSCAFWIGATTLFGILSGSVRQIYWLSGICFLGVLAFTRVRSARGRALIVVCVLITGAVGAASSHWLAQQAYVPAETTLQDLRALSWKEIAVPWGSYLVRYCMGAAVLCLPYSLLFLGKAVRRIPIWLHVPILAGAVVVTHELPQPLPWLGNTLTQNGVLLAHTVSAGEKPTVLSAWVILAIGTAAVASVAYAVRANWRPPILTRHSRFSVLTVPFLLAYLAVLAIRATEFGLYDRYLIPTVFILSTILLARYAGQGIGVSATAWGACCLFALYAVATTHDYFAEAGAKLEATQQILRAGHSRETILSGFEFDCWTQVERTGHINNDLVTFPNDAYQDADDCNGPNDAQMWWRPLVPDVKARYVVSLTPLDKMKEAGFKVVEYWRWLPPARSHIYIEKADLTCKASS